MPSLPPAAETPLQRQRYAWLWRTSLGLTLLVLAALIARDGVGVIAQLFALAVSAQVIGKWLIFVGAKVNNAYGFNAWEIAALISLLDLWIGIGLCTFLPQLEKLPRVGPWLVHTRRRARKAFMEYPRLKRMAFWGVALWVMLPLPASGAITGSFVTRLVGLSRVAGVVAIVAGSVANGVVFAAMAYGLGAHSETLLNNRAVTLVGSLVFLVLLWLGWRRLRQLLREA